MLDVDCAKLKAQCGLLAKPNAPTGNVIYYDASTTFLSIDLQALGDIINGPVVSINASGKLVVDCAALKAQCNLASMSDIPSIPAMPVSGPVVSINATTKELELNCTALKSQCNLASMADIPAYSFAQQASLSGTTLHIANAQDPAAGVDVDLSSLVGTGGSGLGGGAENYLARFTTVGNNRTSTAVGVQVRTKLGTLQSIEIVANKVWNGYTGNFEDAGVHPVSMPQGDTQTPIDTSQLATFPVQGFNNQAHRSLYCKIFEGGIILHYSGGDVTNSDVCGAPYGIKTCGFDGVF